VKFFRDLVRIFTEADEPIGKSVAVSTSTPAESHCAIEGA
jgi:hypothetical protein